MDATHPSGEKKKKKSKSNGFQNMNLTGRIFKGVMKKGYRFPTPIQRKCIPLIMDGLDVVAMARTGSGKTAAFLIPMFERLKEHSTKIGARALILSPTRELAMQTDKFARQLGKFTSFRSCVLVGGESLDAQFDSLTSNPDILIATPGRLTHLIHQSELSLQAVQYFVCDEADRLFEMGFAADLNHIISRLSKTRQTLLFSATLPKLLVDFTRAKLSNPQVIRLDTDLKISEKLEMAFFTIRPDEKISALLYILREIIGTGKLTLVFAATRYEAELIHAILEKSSISTSYVFGAMDQTARKIALGKFRNQKISVLVVTDLAARGLDIPLLDYVVNFNFPDRGKSFIHRVGRVARAGREGIAFSLVSPEELPYMVDLHLLLGFYLKNKPEDAGQELSGRKQPYFGCVPSSLLNFDKEYAKKVMQDTNLMQLEKTCKRAFQLYTKTRSGASPSSVKRAKQLNVTEIHPLLAKGYKQEDQALDAFKSSINSFKPSTTIFETGTMKKSSEFMKRKRFVHGYAIHEKQAKKQKTEEVQQESGSEHSDCETVLPGDQEKLQDKSSNEKKLSKRNEIRMKVITTVPEPKKKKSFRDEKYFLSDKPKKNDFAERQLDVHDHTRSKIEDLMMDIAPDDQETFRQKKMVSRWDKNKKKFVHVSADHDPRKKLKNESGQRIRSRYKTDIYDKWKAKHHRTIGIFGDEEAEDNRVRAKLRKNFRPVNQHLKSELKSRDEIRKSRKEKEKKRVKNMPKQERRRLMKKKSKKNPPKFKRFNRPK